MPWSLQTVGSTIFYIPTQPTTTPITSTAIVLQGNGQIAYTTDVSASTWTVVTNSNIPTNTAGGSYIYYANNLWVSCGGTWNNLNDHKLIGSLDYSFNTLILGNTSYIASSKVLGYVAYSVAYGSDLKTYPSNIWIAGGGTGTGHKLAYSYDLSSSGPWTGLGTTFVVSARVYTVAYGNGRWVVGGYSSGSTIAYKTTDMTTTTGWTGVTGFVMSGGISGQCRSIAYGNGTWVALGSNGTAGGNTIIISTNGTSWTNKGAGDISGVGNCVFYGKDDVNTNIWVAVGQKTSAGGGGVIIYSYDPTVSWTQVSNASAIFTTACYGVAFSGGRWIATGSGGNTVARSYDGKTWTGIHTSTSLALGTAIYSVYGT